MKTDNQIQQDVREELKWDARVSASDIGVTVKDGIATLRGNAPHYMEKVASEEAAQKVCGVRTVVNDLVVSFADHSCKRNDQEIAEAAVSALKWNYQVPEGVKVAVSHGVVTLKGKTEWSYQKEAAKMTVQALMGVSDVINEIEIKSNIKAEDIKTRIEAALKCIAESESSGIKVAVSGDRVTLSGHVHSVADKDDVRWAAFCAPGVNDVENNLSVSTQ